MSRWALPIFILLCACAWIYSHRGGGMLLGDTDTAVALRAIEARHNPLSWFVTDWPLENHFYRPMPTLTLEMDLALHGHDDAGYGVTNALICILGILSLFWFVYELTESPGLASASVVLMTAWITSGTGVVAGLVSYLAVIVFLVGLFRHREKWPVYVPVALLLLFAGSELAGPGLSIGMDLQGRTLGWVPGRTATVMAFFAMIALASYVRMERLGAQRETDTEVTPLDLPATRSSLQTASKPSSQWPWATLSFAASVLAFASYEQAVMLPAVLLGTAVIMKARGFRVRWAWHAAYWVLIPAYLFLRHEIMPSTVSRYQGQQLRFGPSVYYDLIETVFPGSTSLNLLYSRMDMGLALLLDLANYMLIVYIAANIVGLWSTRKRWPLTVGPLVLTFLAYLPMAWLKYFGHYLYWPAMIRSLYVVVLVWMGIEGIVSVVSPQGRQAPPRPSPAPGSLLHH